MLILRSFSLIDVCNLCPPETIHCVQSRPLSWPPWHCICWGWIRATTYLINLAVCLHFSAAFPYSCLFLFSLVLYHWQTGIHMTRSHLRHHSHKPETVLTLHWSMFQLVVTLPHSDVISQTITLCLLLLRYSLVYQGTFHYSCQHIKFLLQCHVGYCIKYLLAVYENASHPTHSSLFCL